MIPRGSIPEAEAASIAGELASLEPAAIRLQIERVFASSQFRNSRRCQALLRYAVDAYLEGSLDKVKERNIGCAVFGRDPGYDTNQDSVVRTTAAEIRKRLAQYYLEPGHENELRVGLPQGSYVPEFRLSAAPAVAPLVPVESPPPVELARPWIATGTLVAGIACIVFLTTGLWLFLHFRPTELDAFWQPLVDDRSEAVICIGQPLRIYTFDGPDADAWNRKMVGDGTAPGASDEVRRHTRVPLSELKPSGSRYFTFGDTMAAVRLGALLARKGKVFQVLGDRFTSYYDLRGRPAVLLGQFNNQWTIGLTTGLRYYLDKNVEKRVYEVRDRQRGDQVVAAASQDAGRPSEYVIVSRVFDAATEKTVVAVAGMTYMGTAAGGDFLTNPTYLRQAFQQAPANWWRKNIQVVLETAIVAGSAGPPKVVATHFW